MVGFCLRASLADLYRRTAVYVDKIFKGAKPAELPVQQPTAFELVINLKKQRNRLASLFRRCSLRSPTRSSSK